MVKLIPGDCRLVLQGLPKHSVDAVVTDPPYGIRIVGQKWDYDVPSVEEWREISRVLKPGGHLLAFSSARTYHRLATNIEDAGFEIRDQIMWIHSQGLPKNRDLGGGWGSALKPAHEPIVVARKPLQGSLAENHTTLGVGGINIDDCRVGGAGRWPANIIHDGSTEVTTLLPQILSRNGKPKSNTSSTYFKGLGAAGTRVIYNESGSAARFFYCAKPSKAERGANNNWPTVKPIKLMRYLCRLVTPKGGTVLDPYMGSGTTGLAALEEGFQFMGIEKEPKALSIAQTRITTCQRVLCVD